MQIAIASSDDIVALYVMYLELVASGREETLELVFAPGVYGVASIGPIQLDLGGTPASTEPKVDVILRGPAGDAPAVLRDMALLVTARSLRLENLILSDRRQGLLDARVARALVIKNCVIANNEWGAPWGGAVLRVAGIHGQPAYTVEIEDTWFVRNSEQSQAALLEVSPATGSYVEQVKLRRVILLDNSTYSDLLVHEARTIRAEDLLVVKHHGGGAVVLRYDRVGQVVIERSSFVVDVPAAIAFEDTRTWSSGLELSRVRVHVTRSARQLPGGVRGTPEIVDARGTPWADAGREALDQLIARLTSRLPDATSRPRLHDALGVVQ